MIDPMDVWPIVYKSDDFELKKAWVIGRLKRFIAELEQIDRQTIDNFLEKNTFLVEGDYHQLVQMLDMVPPHHVDIGEALTHNLPPKKPDFDIDEPEDEDMDDEPCPHDGLG